ncbi:hypothetical protein D3C78_994970 [compost metagenome]
MGKETMWTYAQMAQGIGWGTLILASPLIFAYTRKITSYLSYKLFPKDIIIEYTRDGAIIEGYYLKGSFLGRQPLRKLTKEELSKIEADT